MCETKYKLSVLSTVAITGLSCLLYIDISFMGLNEWKYAYNGFYNVKFEMEKLSSPWSSFEMKAIKNSL